MAVLKFRAMADFLDVIKAANFVHGNVNGLTGDPSIRLASSGPVDSLINGQIVLGREEQGAITFLGTRRNETYFLHGYISYAYSGDADEQTVHEMMWEMDRLLRVNNQVPARNYYFEITSAIYDGNYIAGRIDFIVEATRLGVDATQ